MSAKTYAMWGGIILLVLGVIGLFTGTRVFTLNSDIIEDLIHLVGGAILAYVGFSGTDAQASTWAKVFGVVFLVIGVVGFFLPKLFNLLPSGLGAADNIVHLIYGVVGVWAGWMYKPATA